MLFNYTMEFSRQPPQTTLLHIKVKSIHQSLRIYILEQFLFGFYLDNSCTGIKFICTTLHDISTKKTI